MNQKLHFIIALKYFFLAPSFFTFINLQAEEEDYQKYAMFESTAERAQASDPVVTRVPVNLTKGMRIGLVGNTLFDRMRDFGHFEALLQLGHPDHKLVLRNLAWSADEIDLQPRPADFADAEQHLVAMKADLILAAFGFNEAFGGKEALPSFEIRFAKYLQNLKSKAYNGKAAPKIVLVSIIEFFDVIN